MRREDHQQTMAIAEDQNADVRTYPYGLPARFERQLSALVAQLVRSGFKQITDREMEVLAYAYLMGQSTEETAAVLGLSPLTVKTHLHNARKQLLGSRAPRRAYGPIVYAMGYLAGAMDVLHRQQNSETLSIVPEHTAVCKRHACDSSQA